MSEVLVEMPRLRVVRLEADLISAALTDREELSSILNADVVDEWPLPEMSDLLHFIRDQLGSHPDSTYWVAVILAKAKAVRPDWPKRDTLIGDIGFHAAPVDGGVEVGYSVMPEFRNLGLATEALAGFLRWGFQDPAILSVTARCEEHNIASRRVLEKNGFDLERLLGGHLHFSKRARR